MTSPLLIFALGVTTNRGGGLIRAGRPAPVASRSRSSRMSEAEEKAVGKLEQELSAAVAAEDYSQAAALRDRLAALQMDSEYGALSANSEFYRAFSERDVEAMRRLWLPSESIVCAHPGHEPIVGFDAVISSWRDIFRSAPAGGLEVAASSVRCSTPAANVARVTCIEEVKPGESKLVATNIYERHEDGSWRMSLHHAGPMVG
uniref:UVR domain-containing protein n=1 Tax=Emiliania huxleyi TaxID=2903 RepID=A0A6V2QU24_EMIHU|mmetsp:Transcript_3860/g.11467  ORF Transcript_3860/g.11467 Transcript_3860/m.11467 type:complete len:203 (+) Transcript_3860:45-653(+)